MTTRKDSVMSSQRSGNVGHNGHAYASSKPQHFQNSYIPTGPSRGAGHYMSNMGHNTGDGGLASLSSALGGMNMHHQHYGHMPRGHSQNGGSGSDYTGLHIGQTPTLYVPGQQHFMYAGNQLLHGHGHGHIANGVHNSSGMYTAHPYQHYMPGAGYGGYHQQMSENTPINHAWTPRLQSASDMPTLITPSPRDSVSSNEVDIPGTPTAYAAYGGFNGITTIDRSPSNGYNHSGAPSPLSQSFGLSQAHKLVTPPSSIPPAIMEMITREPPIPRAIPAPSSPLKPLDRSLENKNGETNVYIRGLLPETTDDMLHQWGSRFGDIQSSKSIIDMKTNLCKGFGFIKYFNYDDAGQCIRGFHYLGYEVSFARESFYSKLKKFADEGNTNLYVSNIPKNLNEHELSAIFLPHKVCSSRILRDSGGNGRGVGFARFESRDDCEDVIRDYNNAPVSKPNGEEHLIQIRYADTQEQKLLKQHTAAARQFRAAEFEYGVLQARNGGLLAPPHERLANLTPSECDAANEFEQFMRNNAGQNGNGPRSSVSGRNAVASGNTPTQRSTSFAPQIQSPLKLEEPSTPSSRAHSEHE